MKKNHYSLSFTTGSLLLKESVTVAEQFLALSHWNTVREIILNQNLLQVRTLNTSRRLYQEVASRLKTLYYSELKLLVQGSQEEQGYLLWLALCRRYQFIADFAVEVLRERFVNLQKTLNYEDFNSFYNDKADFHPELEKIALTTRMKLRQVLFKMMREANLVVGENWISPVILSPRMLQVTPQENYQDFFCFPIFELDLKQWQKELCVENK